MNFKSIKYFILVIQIFLIKSCVTPPSSEKKNNICQSYLSQNNEQNNCGKRENAKLCKSCRTIAPTEVTRDSIQKWVAPNHLDHMCEVAKELETILTVRKAGKHTIQRLAQGYPTKGHDILAKTLKPASLKKLKKVPLIKKDFAQNFYPKEWLIKGNLSGQQLIEKLTKNDYLGFVGWWEKGPHTKKIPVGLYTVYSGCQRLQKNLNQVIIPKGGCRISFKELANSIPRDAYTGDYDLHDIIVSSQNKRIKKQNKKCSMQELERKTICLLNESINRKCHTDKISKEHCKLIRHGAQAYYFQYQQETGELLRPSLVSISKKILVIKPKTKDKKCSYFLLGKQNQVSVLEEYLNLYRLADYEKKQITKERDISSTLAFKNSLDRNVTDSQLQKLENQSLLKTRKKTIEYLKKSLKKEKKSLKEDCIEALYKAELLSSITKHHPSLISGKTKKYLKLSKRNFCELKNNNNCPLIIYKNSGKSGHFSWKRMSYSFCSGL